MYCIFLVPGFELSISWGLVIFDIHVGTIWLLVNFVARQAVVSVLSLFWCFGVMGNFFASHHFFALNCVIVRKITLCVGSERTYKRITKTSFYIFYSYDI